MGEGIAGADLRVELEALREAGGQRFDPVRYHYLDCLARRIAQQQGAVRDLLQTKLQLALADYRARFMHMNPASTAGSRPTARRGSQTQIKRQDNVHGKGLMALRALNQHIQNRSKEVGAPGQHAVTTGGMPAMQSVGHFKAGWSQIVAQEQVQLALRQGPENAGPLNSHRLVLRSLEAMQRLSPSYLQRFVSHLDVLLCLDSAHTKPAASESKPKPPRRKKSTPAKS